MSIQTDNRLIELIETHAPQLLNAGKAAFAKLGRGALFTRPSVDNGTGKADVTYLTEADLRADNDPALSLVEKYDPTNEAVLIVVRTNGIITYHLSPDGVYVWLQGLTL